MPAKELRVFFSPEGPLAYDPVTHILWVPSLQPAYTWSLVENPVFRGLSPDCQIEAVYGFRGYQGEHREGERGRTLFEDTFRFVHGFWSEEFNQQPQHVRDLPIFKGPSWGYPPGIVRKRKS